MVTFPVWFSTAASASLVHSVFKKFDDQVGPVLLAHKIRADEREKLVRVGPPGYRDVPSAGMVAASFF